MKTTDLPLYLASAWYNVRCRSIRFSTNLVTIANSTKQVRTPPNNNSDDTDFSLPHWEKGVSEHKKNNQPSTAPPSINEVI